MREAIWGRAEGQSTATIVTFLVRHGLVTYKDVAALPHGRCGHRPADIDPTAAR